MMPFALRLAAFFLVCALGSTTAEPALRAPAALAVVQQDAIVAAARKELRAFGGREPIPGVFLALYVPGKAPYVKSVGYADLRAKAPFQLGDKFRVGSNTKTFVVTVLLQLVDEGRVHLDDPLSTFALGVTIPNAKNITLRELCEMRSGLFEAYNTPQFDKMNITPQTKIAPQRLVRWAVAQKPLFAPGSRYNYSNTNYLILGLVIQALTHDTVGNQIRKRLLKPMALRGTSYPDGPSMPTPYSHGYGLNAQKNWEDVSVDIPPAVTGAAGAMISTVPDMARWVKSYVRGTMNGKRTQRERLRCIPIAPGSDLRFGLGIGCGGGWYGYTGGLPGYHTAAYYLPSQDITLIAFVNAQREQPSPGAANAIVRDITRIVTPKNVLF